MLLKKKKKDQTQKQMSAIGSVEVVWVVIAPYCAGKSSVWTVTCLKLAALNLGNSGKT